MVFSLSKSNEILEEALRFFPTPFIIHILPKTVISFSGKKSLDVYLSQNKNSIHIFVEVLYVYGILYICSVDRRK